MVKVLSVLTLISRFKIKRMLGNENRPKKTVSWRIIPNQNRLKGEQFNSFLFNQSIFTSRRTRGRKNQNSLSPNEEAISKAVNDQNYNQPILLNTNVDFSQQQNRSYPSFMSTTPSYGTITHDHSYGGYLPQSQLNPAFMNSHPCYKCNSMVFLNIGQFYQCVSCGRLCCALCITNNSFPISFYQCEYCLLHVALQMTNH